MEHEGTQIERSGSSFPFLAKIDPEDFQKILGRKVFATLTSSPE